jgi:hypothetical protein
VPGPGKLIGSVFGRVWVKQVIRRGVRLFPDDVD